MTARPTDIDEEEPTVRTVFARRLKELRVPRGYRTARSLARALGIDENRYTRYERAEVEPGLALIVRICRLLKVSPNDLLGEPDPRTRRSGRSPARAVDQASPAAPEERPGPGGSGAPPPDNLAIATAAWTLAEEVATLRRSRAGGNQPAITSQTSPLASMSETSAIFRGLMQRPYEAIAELLEHPAISTLPSDEAQELRRSIETLVGTLKAGATRQ